MCLLPKLFNGSRGSRGDLICFTLVARALGDCHGLGAFVPPRSPARGGWEQPRARGSAEAAAPPRGSERGAPFPRGALRGGEAAPREREAGSIPVQHPFRKLFAFAVISTSHMYAN